MTRRAPITQAEIRRAVRAVESVGLPVAGVTVKPDGSITVEVGHKPDQPVDAGREIVL